MLIIQGETLTLSTTYYYKAACYNNSLGDGLFSANTSIRTFTYDEIAPTFSTTLDNNLTSVLNNLTWSFNISDDETIAGWNLTLDGIFFNETLLNATIDNRDSDTADTQKNASGPYLYNDTLTIYLNGTLLNLTIVDLVQEYDTNTEKNAAGYLYNDSTTIYLNDSKLNASVIDLTNGTYVPYSNPINNVVLTGYNLTADFLFGFVDWSQLTNVPNFLTGVTNNPYVYLNGTEVAFNETALNATISDLDTDTDSRVNTSGPYLYNDTYTVYFNSTLMNITIQQIADTVDTDTQKNTCGPYLYKDTVTIYFNETNRVVLGLGRPVLKIPDGFSTDAFDIITVEITQVIFILPFSLPQRKPAIAMIIHIKPGDTAHLPKC